MNSDSLWRAAVIASLPQITPRRLALMIGDGGPDAVWSALRGDTYSPVVSAVAQSAGAVDVWRVACSDTAVARMAETCSSHSIGVTYRRHGTYPDALVGDHQAPVVLFHRGALEAVGAHRRCGIVGTRNATPMGRRFAEQLGADLAEAHIAVVSGLAKGIDASAHSGVRSKFVQCARSDLGKPIAVVANGLDTVYPRHHTALFDFVAAEGVVLSESAPGTPPEPFRFPLRNRIIAALSEVLIVVESRASGGSMHTVDAAMTRGTPVLAVPGAPGATASIGTNRLIAEGCAPCVHLDDVLVALGLQSTGRVSGSHVLDHDARAVLQVLSRSPQALDSLVSQTGFELVHLVRVLGGLEARGLVAHEAGWWQGAIAM